MRPIDAKAIALLGLLGLLGLSLASCGGPSARVRPGYRAVRPGVAFEMLRDNPNMVVLDVRTFADYSASAGHLERAVSVPVAELDALWPSLQLSAEDTVLLYSGDGGETQMEVSRTLLERGLRYVIQIDGGLEAWLRGGFAVRVEDAPLSPLRPPSVH